MTGGGQITATPHEKRTDSLHLKKVWLCDFKTTAKNVPKRPHWRSSYCRCTKFTVLRSWECASHWQLALVDSHSSLNQLLSYSTPCYVSESCEEPGGTPHGHWENMHSSYEQQWPNLRVESATTEPRASGFLFEQLTSISFRVQGLTPMVCQLFWAPVSLFALLIRQAYIAENDLRRYCSHLCKAFPVWLWTDGWAVIFIFS